MFLHVCFFREYENKIGPKCFLHWKRSRFFFWIVVPIYLVGPEEMTLKLAGKFSKYLMTVFIMCKLRWGILDKRRKDQPKVIFNWKISFFSKSCVSNNLLGVKGLILQLVPKAPKNLFQPKKNYSKSAIFGDI